MSICTLKNQFVEELGERIKNMSCTPQESLLATRRIYFHKFQFSRVKFPTINVYKCFAIFIEGRSKLEHFTTLNRKKKNYKNRRRIRKDQLHFILFYFIFLLIIKKKNNCLP